MLRFLWLIGWIVSRVMRRNAVLVGDRDRDRAALRLREHYAGGYLTLDDLSHRTGRALSARSRGQLRRALRGVSAGMFVESVQATVRDVVLVVCTGAYVVFSLALLLVIALTLLIHGASASTLVVFLLVWLVPTYLLSRLWRGNAR